MKIKALILLMVTFFEVFPVMANSGDICCSEKKTIVEDMDSHSQDEVCSSDNKSCCSDQENEDNDCCQDNCPCCVSTIVFTLMNEGDNWTRIPILMWSDNHFYLDLVDNLFVPSIHHPPSA